MTAVAGVLSLVRAVVTVVGRGLHLLLPALVLLASAVILGVAAVEDSGGRRAARHAA
ncbi:hypothetical protein [uncultured Pseudokineococcus sp.]|uniref:hypothetical protein n=1 Tax=uncultured Pseudokineococcus sp. TaxID=1642928 RepID=UPI00262FFBF5|nr:hypothetical protein [uncultured Pseudokineococcus sp.]